MNPSSILEKDKDELLTLKEACTYVATKNEKAACAAFLLCSGGQTRTDDLWVMSPTSYQLLHPAICLVLFFVST